MGGDFELVVVAGYGLRVDALFCGFGFRVASVVYFLFMVVGFGFGCGFVTVFQGLMCGFRGVSVGCR